MKKRYLLFPLILFLYLGSYLPFPFRVYEGETNTAPYIQTDVEKPMVIVIASFNNKKYYKHNLDSVFSQDYSNFRVIYTSDASTDGTAELVRSYVKEKGFEEKFTLIDNKVNMGACYNCYTMIHSARNDEIVCILDGDDALANDQVLKRVNAAYADDHVWMTYGGIYPKQVDSFNQLKTDKVEKMYINKMSKSLPVAKKMLEERAHRRSSYQIHHLRTFYTGLFNSIPKECWLFFGDFFASKWDIALVYYLIDRAGDHVYCIEDSLYEYNVDNPINVFRKGRIKRLPVYFKIKYFSKKLPPYSSKKDFLGDI